jgi:nicotinate-nucleotide pyrophosphorylase (carboxylating)
MNGAAAQVYRHPDVAAVIRAALAEDLRGIGDLTCQTLVPAGAQLDAAITAKAAGVVCGLELFAAVVAELGAALASFSCLPDGAVVAPGDVALRCRGDAATLLIAERTALNLCQRLSGTASMARRYVAAVAGTRAEVFDTRKTTPGLRVLEKHAVVAGGARNHRIGLYDQVLIKDNHIALMAPDPTLTGPFSAPAEAVRRCRARLGDAVVVEVEIEDLRDLEPAIAAGADIVLLDNMAPGLLAQAVTRRDAAQRPGARATLLEASGGITLTTIRAVAESGVERISTGALTHSVQALDLSMRCAPVG